MPNSITLAGSEPAPNMFGASSELASVMEFGFYFTYVHEGASRLSEMILRVAQLRD